MQQRGIHIKLGALECAEFLDATFEDWDIYQDDPDSNGLQSLVDSIRWSYVESESHDDPDDRPTPADYAALEYFYEHHIVPLDSAETLATAFHFMGVYWIEEHGRNSNYGGEDKPKSYSNWCLAMSEAGYEIAGAINDAIRFVREYDARVSVLHLADLVEITAVRSPATAVA